MAPAATELSQADDPPLPREVQQLAAMVTSTNQRLNEFHVQLERLRVISETTPHKDQGDPALQHQVDELGARLVALEQKLEGALAMLAPHDSAADLDLDLSTEAARSLEFTLDDLLRVVIKHKASDLHIKPNAPPTVRLDGELVPVGNRPLSQDESRILVLSAIPAVKRHRLLERQEVDHAYVTGDTRFRLNAFLERGNFSAAFRLVSSVIPSFSELGLPPVLERLSMLHNGLVLVTGPAGSGKSTTLASMLDYINCHRKTHVVTIEDPIEYYHRDRNSYVTQREVGTDTTSFTEALRQALRQDPNVIMLGEMRDAETIMTAVTAAETGHLVLSTLHTPNAVQAIDRVVDSFTGPAQRQVRMLLGGCLRAVVSQKLLTRSDGRGRVPACEVMICTSTIASHILDGQTQEIPQYIHRGTNEGMQTFTQSLARLVEQGRISREEAMFHADQPTELRLATEGHTAAGGSDRPQESAGDYLDYI